MSEISVLRCLRQISHFLYVDKEMAFDLLEIFRSCPAEVNLYQPAKMRYAKPKTSDQATARQFAEALMATANVAKNADMDRVAEGSRGLGEETELYSVPKADVDTSRMAKMPMIGGMGAQVGEKQFMGGTHM